MHVFIGTVVVCGRGEVGEVGADGLRFDFYG